MKHTTSEEAPTRPSGEERDKDSAANVEECAQRERTEWKEKVISMISHDFRTPMSAILSSAELLEYYGNRLDEKKKQEHLRRIQTAVKEMCHLLESIVLKEKSGIGE